MIYVKVHKQTLTVRWLQRFSVISTAPAMKYPLQEELIGLPSLQAASLPITVLSPSRAYRLPAPQI